MDHDQHQRDWCEEQPPEKRIKTSELFFDSLSLDVICHILSFQYCVSLKEIRTIRRAFFKVPYELKNGSRFCLLNPNIYIDKSFIYNSMLFIIAPWIECLFVDTHNLRMSSIQRISFAKSLRNLKRVEFTDELHSMMYNLICEYHPNAVRKLSLRPSWIYRAYADALQKIKQYPNIGLLKMCLSPPIEKCANIIYSANSNLTNLKQLNIDIEDVAYIDMDYSNILQYIFKEMNTIKKLVISGGLHQFTLDGLEQNSTLRHLTLFNSDYSLSVKDMQAINSSNVTHLSCFLDEDEALEVLSQNKKLEHLYLKTSNQKVFYYLARIESLAEVIIDPSCWSMESFSFFTAQPPLSYHFDRISFSNESPFVGVSSMVTLLNTILPNRPNVNQRFENL